MLKRTTLVLRALAAAAVLSALAFGAQEAVASSRMATSCNYEPPLELGTCMSELQCDLDCEAYYGPGNGGYCTPTGNCCICEH
jgi:hypothetical protein